MNKRKTIYNWKWWAALPIALPIIAIISVPRAVIFILELMIACVEYINIGERHSKLSKRLVDWVHKDT